MCGLHTHIVEDDEDFVEICSAQRAAPFGRVLCCAVVHYPTHTRVSARTHKHTIRSKLNDRCVGSREQRIMEAIDSRAYIWS